MKKLVKTLIVSVASSVIAVSAAHAGGACNQQVEVEKVWLPEGGVEFNVTVSYKTPSMTHFVTGGTYYGLEEPQVTPFAVNAAKRLCHAANDPLRLDDPCRMVRFIIEGALEGYGSQNCNEL